MEKSSRVDALAASTSPPKRWRYSAEALQARSIVFQAGAASWAGRKWGRSTMRLVLSARSMYSPSWTKAQTSVRGSEVLTMPRKSSEERTVSSQIRPCRSMSDSGIWRRSSQRALSSSHISSEIWSRTARAFSRARCTQLRTLSGLSFELTM